MKKRFLSMSLVVAMAAVAMTGCGGNSGSSDKSGDADTIKIGGMGPITGLLWNRSETGFTDCP